MALNAPFNMNRPQAPLVVKTGEGPPVTISKDWYIFLVSIYNAVTQGIPQPEESLTVGGSPFTYQAVIKGQVFISGGTVSAIEFSRDGTNWYNTGTTSGFVQTDFNDYVRVTYTVTPTMIYFPF